MWKDGMGFARAGWAGAVVAAVLAIGAGEAAAQRVCSNMPTGAQTIDCTRGDANDIDIDAHDVAISTTGAQAFGVYARHTGSGAVNVALTGGSVTTTGAQGYGVIGWHVGASGAVDIDIKNTIVKTSGFNAFGVIGVHQGAGTVAVNVDIEGGVVETTGYPAHAVRAVQAGPGDVALVLKDTTVRTTNAGTAHGAVAQHTGATGSLRLDVRGGSVETFGMHSFAIFGSGTADSAPGGVAVSVTDASVTTRGRFARAIVARHRGEGAVAVDVLGNTAVTAEGEGGIGVEALGGSGGTVEIEVGAEVAIEAPFANGIVGRRTAPGLQMAAPGRMVVTHRGQVRARNVGIFTWVDPMSGSTFGDGESAAVTAGDEPAIHIVSSGDIAVGENVMDAYIRAAVAGEDETLQAGEQAVLDAIAAGDSNALGTALAALPDSYSDAWRTRMRGFLAARALSPTDRFSWTGGVEPTDPGRRLADEAAGEILGLAHAGIRAMALSHLAVVNHIREGDVDPNIVASVATIAAIAANARTPQQQETLAMQQETLATQRMLSPAERAVLAAALTGGDLDAALAALPAAYTDAWKDEVRRRAAGYNTGDIQVDIDGGTIASDGDGVDARYALAHDRNGAIAVTVAEGARIAGARHGLYLGGAGLAANGLRAQTATVAGMAMGGTGAGVYLAGGGRLTVAASGRIGATSGMAVLSDGAGDLVATVAGEVAGDIRARGSGALTLDVRAGGVVTGTVHDAGPMTVAGSIGRLLYSHGGAVTVAAGGRLTGIEGEAIRSAAGDLSVTVARAGAVAGAILAMDGALTATVAGRVAGDIHTQGGALTATVAGRVAGDIHTQGGDLTAMVTGTIAGDIRAQDGDLVATVAGRVDGNLIGEGALNAIVSGTVTGDILGRGTGEHMVTVAEGASVTGTIHLAASTVALAGTAGQVRLERGGVVTVAAGGRIAGIEGVAIRSASGDLTATVAGTLAGDVFALGAGAHRVTVAQGGRVAGTVRLSSAGDTVAVDGAVARVQLDEGGMVTVGASGQVTGIEVAGAREAIRSEAGELVVAIELASDETAIEAVSRVRGRIEEKGGTPSVVLQRGGEAVPVAVGRAGTRDSVPSGAFDVGLRTDERGGYRLESGYAPRTRVYEALPSVVLALNDLPARALSVARAPNGGWGQVEASRGSWKADATTTGTAYDRRRYGVQAGIDVPLGEAWLVGVSLHHRRVRADVDAGGKIEAAGTGAGLSARLDAGDGLYLDGRAAATWSAIDLSSQARGVLEEDVVGVGWALGLEAGQRLSLAAGGLGTVLVTPRAGLTHAQASLDGFTDALGVGVAPERSRSLKGRAGVAVELTPRAGSRLFASLDVERELRRKLRLTVGETRLETRLRPSSLAVGLGGAHGWGAGRYQVQGMVSYSAGGGHSYGGGIALTTRF